MREERSRGGSGKLLLLVTVGLLFWVGVYGVLYVILKHVRGAEELGPFLAAKILGLVLLSFVTILVLSNLITALSSFFLAKDLDLLVSAPVDWLRLYLAKLGETLLHSSWMVALMAVPILAAYGVIYRGGLLFVPYAVLTIVPMLVLPAVVGSAVTLILVNVFPARRTRDLLSIIALGAAAGLILLLRLIRPERLARPEGFRNLLDFLAVLRTPTSPFLPSEWATNAIMSYLRGPPDPLPLMLLWTTAAALVTIGAMLHRRLCAQGFTKGPGAAALQRARSPRAPVGQVLGRRGAPPRAGRAAHRPHERAARGGAGHDGDGAGDGLRPDVGHRRAGARVRCPVPAVRDGERRPDPHVVRRARLHDDDDRVARGGDRGAVAGRLRVRPGRIRGRAGRRGRVDDLLVRRRRRHLRGGDGDPVADRPAENGELRVLERGVDSTQDV